MDDKLSWSDIDDLGLELHEAYPEVDPLKVKFTELKALVEKLPCFEAESGRNANEQILEAVQAVWIEERENDPSSPDGDDEDKERPYQPNDPYRPSP